ncbi:equilibrative nucleoside transporter 4 isoform X1 [Desmodus rotundus]|uniref:equilibrative nucleoside transporter 4 isoform X1 n=1 Tax=Desmodus rotundus TaxID=9430 RepID=UPI00238109AC|nr:equilibrative nucleoside transporter 4 isoform X1 [Desmodus rotundus]XP_053783407.1 equilibrative nucleoside transporter 4 isoform X1 [Desmodus rotundus]XP_053783408.1 equilibrative nucleoside transporter 4 isoform X1 [Desmodus rotundus]
MGTVGSQHLQEPSVAGTPARSVVTSFGFDSCPLEEEAAAGVALGQGSAARGAPILTDSAAEGPAPDDRYHAIYFAMLLAGVGFLLPYNSFITDVDYLHHKLPGTSIVFDMSLTYILVALVAVLLNNVLVERLSLHTRITAGYLLALGPLLFISICDVWLQLFSRDQAYAINLAAVGIVAFGCTVQQSSFYGYTGMLPKRYTQGVMTGESTAGVMVSLSRILTKLLLPDERASTLIFFLVSAGLELLCFLLHLLVRRSRFVLHHTVRPRDSRPGHRAGYRVHHDVAAEDIHFENQGPALANSVSPKDSPAHEVVIRGRGAYMRFDEPQPRVERSWPSFRALLLHRYVVARVIWADMLSIAVTYFITLCLFPGLESEIRHCVLGEWLPILIMAVFNLSDFVGKILAALPMDWRGTHLLACSCLRVVFIPLFILCVYPSGTPTLRHPAWPCVFSLLMGISNGYFGSVPMILAAGKVGPRQRELAGNTMTVSYMTGLTLGSAVAYCTYSLTRDGHRSCFQTSASNASFSAGL